MSHHLCPRCGGRKKKKNTKFCSHACARDDAADKVIAKWLAGEHHGLRGSGGKLSRTVRTHILKLAGYKCTKCGWGKKHPKTGLPPLQVHHINGNTKDTRLENLECLCPNCHALTPNWGAHNPIGRHRKNPNR